MSQPSQHKPEDSLQHAAEHEKPAKRNPVLFYLMILFAVAFLLLLILGCILFGWLVGVLTKSLRFIAHLSPLGILDSVAGGAVGFATGVILIALILLGIQFFSHITYSPLGWLSPERVSNTVLLAKLMDILPVAI